jgi:class 3 adenylate cyclase
LRHEWKKRAKAHHIACAISGDVAEALPDGELRLRPLGDEQIKGISVEIPIFEYRVEGGRGTGEVDRTPTPSPRLAVSAGSKPS